MFEAFVSRTRTTTKCFMFLKISLLLRFQLKHRFISAHPCNPHPTTQKSNPRQYAFRDLKATIFASY